MCGTNDLLQVDLCYCEGPRRRDDDDQKQLGDTCSCSSSNTVSSRNRKSSSSNSTNSGNSSSVEKVWKETQQLMEDREQLVRIMTHVCSQQFSGGAYRTLARYSQGCWRGCSAEENVEGGRRAGGGGGGVGPQRPSHYYVHPHTPSAPPLPPSNPPPASPSSVASDHPPSLLRHLQQQMPSCGSCGCWGTDSKASSGALTEGPPPHPSPAAPSSGCSFSGGSGGSCWRRGRWRWGRCCQCPCGARCRRCPSSALMKGAAGSSAGGGGGGLGQSTTAPMPIAATLSHHYPVPTQCPSVATLPTTTTTTTAATTTPTTTTNPAAVAVSSRLRRRARTEAGDQQNHHQPSPTSSVSPSASTLARTAAAAASPKASRGGAPHAHPSLLTILLLLVVTLARFTDGCSSRSTPKPRPASPTMRPNITFQTYACPPAYAAWYCLNGATCFTVKIGESILYNCECADGYMGQRCEFKDLDGSYIPAREKVLLETASIAGGATVACVLVFIVLFAVYIFMQKDKDKRCRDLDDGRNSDRQPFSGYQNPKPEVFRTISNPYARTLDELSHVEVESAGHGINTVNTGTAGRIGSGSSAGGGGGGGGGSGGGGVVGGNPVYSNLHHNGKQQTTLAGAAASSPTAL
ncbi:uncharacterized protein LOC135205339 [Macrobrachium nipponense]|uniref:uncharacterized protein LOC135205339 n=1 Tax=Macrobrachium nipponense TaxID=159736 RepID=UPI0030C87607